jgi:hypothetical protein
MQNQLKESFDLMDKDIEFLLNEARICSLNIWLDLQADLGELYSRDMKELGDLYRAIKSKATSERTEYFNKSLNLYERAITKEYYEEAGNLKKELDFFVHSFLWEVPLRDLDYTPSPSIIKIKQIRHR